jgi:hypothetical protein
LSDYDFRFHVFASQILVPFRISGISNCKVDAQSGHTVEAEPNAGGFFQEFPSAFVKFVQA